MRSCCYFVTAVIKVVIRTATNLRSLQYLRGTGSVLLALQRYTFIWFVRVAFKLIHLTQSENCLILFNLQVGNSNVLLYSMYQA